MATIKTFEDMEAWRMARELSNNIYDLSLTGTFAKDYGLKNQINRSSGSVMDNIAEGFERNGNREFIQFLSVAKGSAGEVRSQLYRALDRKHITKEQHNGLKENALQISKSISGLINYLNKSDLKGIKFQDVPLTYNTPDSSLNLDLEPEL